MAFDNDFLDELRGRVGLADLVGRRVALKRRGQEWTGLCPFHKEKTPSFTVNEAKGFYHCFGCGAHGGALDFVMATEGLSFPETVEKLAHEAGLALPAPSPNARADSDRRNGLLALMEAASKWFEAQLASSVGAAARRYLEERALEPETIAQFRVGYAPDRRGVLNGDMLSRDFTETQLLEVGLLRRPEDRTDAYDFFRDRIIFPIADRQNRVIAFGGRSLGEARAKYLNSPETDIFQKGRTLYNLAAARQAAHETGKVIVAEGYMDVIALHRAGIRHSVAPLGTALTEEQMRGLWRLTAEPTLCFDGDAAGKRAAGRAAERALPLLEPGRSLGFVELAPGQDPDSLLATAGSQALQEALEEPKPLARLLWEGALEGRRLDTPERRAGLRRDLGRLAAQIGNKTVREYYRQFFRQELNKLFGDKSANRSDLRGSSQHNNPGWRNIPARALPAHNGLTSDDAATVRGERLLLSVILNHPALLDEVFDEFSVLRFNSPTLDRLHRLLLEHVGLHQALDAAVLKHDLTDSDLRDEVDDLTGENAAKLAPFASADAPMDEARKGWALIYGVSRLPSLEADLRAAREAAEKELTDESQSRHEAVRTELERARREAEKMTGSGFEEAGPL